MNALEFVALFAAFAGTTRSLELAEPLEVFNSVENLSVYAAEKIRNAIEGAREQMSFGFPELGIPVLDPISISHKDIDLSIGDVTINGTLDDFLITGISKFNVDNLKLNILRKTLHLKMAWNSLSIETLYNLWVESSKLNYETRVHRTGSANIDLQGVTIQGDIKYSLNLIKGKLKLRQLKLYVTIDGLSLDITGLVSDEPLSPEQRILLEDLILSFINNNPEKIAEISNDILLPIFNGILGEKSLDDFIGGGKRPKQPSLPEGDETTIGAYVTY